ncbi:MAG: PilZ domain-containing protein [Deltaproteobacteria bacterium]|nr:PilZ domain-containing protein [Deltaproteobacteria bacterium]
MSALDQVFQYRTLVGKCETGQGLDFDEIDALIAIEAAFAAGPDDAHPDGRRFRRERTSMPGLVRGGDLNDMVTISELAPGGVVLAGAPYVDLGMAIEIVVDQPLVSRSYRFKGIVQWTRDDGDDYFLGVALVGTPVLIHYGAIGHDEVVERIAA